MIATKTIQNPPYWNPWTFPDANKIWEILQTSQGKTLRQINKKYLPYQDTDERLENFDILVRFIKESGDLNLMAKYELEPGLKDLSISSDGRFASAPIAPKH